MVIDENRNAKLTCMIIRLGHSGTIPHLFSPHVNTLFSFNMDLDAVNSPSIVSSLDVMTHKNRKSD